MKYNLIVQSQDISTPDLKALHALAEAHGIERINSVAHDAFRLLDVNAARRGAIAVQCTSQQLDFALLPKSYQWESFGLLAMDMDSTLITIECIDEIADFIGKKAEIAAITASAMRGEIDWPESLHQRVALLAGLDEAVLARVYDERLKLSPGAETLIAAAKKHQHKLLLVSGGFTFFTERLKARLGFDTAFSNVLEVLDGKLTGRVIGPLCDANAKASRLREAAAALGISSTQCIAIGDGANDLPMMAEAGLSIAYHAKPIVQAKATVAINFCGLDAVVAMLSN